MNIVLVAALNSNLNLPKKIALFGSMKVYLKCFLFHLKSSFCSQDI